MPQETAESDVVKVLNDDGIEKLDMHGSINQTRTSIAELKRRMGDPPWSVRLVYNETMSAAVIAQNPGEGNRFHYHPDSDEYWFILEGQIEYRIEGLEPFVAGAGELVFCHRRVRHVMTTVGGGPSLRLACGKPDVDHVYREE